MQLIFDITIQKPLATVWAAFDDAANMQKWQPTLKSFEHLSGTPGQPGAVSKLVYEENGHLITLHETITVRREQAELTGVYDSGMATNHIRNTFAATDAGSTQWHIAAQFQFKGFFKYLTFVFKGGVRRRIQEDCLRFKQMVEGMA